MLPHTQLIATLVLMTLPHAYANAAIDPVEQDAQQQLRQQERLQQLRNQQEINPDARQQTDTLKVPLTHSETIAAQESPCFTISQIKLVGDDAAHFEFARNQVLANTTPAIIGSCLGVQGINAVMTRVQNAIIKRGYVTTRVLASPQNLKSGVLELTIIPGKVHAIRFTQDSNRWISSWNALPLSAGDLLNVRDLEQGLENFQRVPGASASFNLEPASGDTAKPGESNVVIQRTQSKPFRLSVNMDDGGSRSTGKYQGGVTLSGDNLLSLSDLFYASYNHSLGGGYANSRGNDGLVLHYSLPWDYWLLSVTGSNNHFYQTVAGASQNYVYSGNAQQGEVKLSRLIYRNNINKTSVSVKGFLRKSNNYIDDTEIEVQRRRTAGFVLGFDQSWLLGSSKLEYGLEYHRGTGAQSALSAPEELFGEGSSRFKYFTANLNLSVPFHVQAPWGSQSLQYSATLRGQTNHTPLTPQDRFGIGNRFTVRGFDGESILLGDSGLLVRNELIAPIAQSGQAVYLGVDYGKVGGRSSDLLAGKELAGGVLGLRGSVGKPSVGTLSYDVFWGMPIMKPEHFVTHSNVFGFSLFYAY